MAYLLIKAFAYRQVYVNEGDRFGDAGCVHSDRMPTDFVRGFLLDLARQDPKFAMDNKVAFLFMAEGASYEVKLLTACDGQSTFIKWRPKDGVPANVTIGRELVECRPRSLGSS